MTNPYLKRTYEQMMNEVDDMLEMSDPVHERAAQVGQVIKEILAELYTNYPADAEANAEELLPECEKRISDIRVMIAPTMRSSDFTPLK